MALEISNEANNTAANTLQEYGVKTAEFIANYLDVANTRILAEGLTGQAAAEATVTALADAYEQASNLAKSYVNQADLYGLSNNREWQDALDKAAFEQRQVADYLRNRVADGLDELVNMTSTIADSSITKVIGEAGGIAIDAYQIIDKLIQSDYNGATAAGVGALAGGIAGAVLVGTTWPAWVVAGLAVGASWISEEYYNDAVAALTDLLIAFDPLNIIPDTGHSDYQTATGWVRPRTDPLVLDLDGDGVELVAENGTAGAMFDHDGDGIKTAMQWVGSDDGFVVFDRNGNGQIDNGMELLGDKTPIESGIAADGFAALADFDSNGDGQVDTSDAGYSQLQVWRDLNGDGTSQSGELMSLQDAGVASLNVTPTPVTGNPEISATGTYTKTDGSTGAMADVMLFEGTVTETAVPVTPSAEAAALPTLDGMGWVRDLSEACMPMEVWSEAA